MKNKGQFESFFRGRVVVTPPMARGVRLRNAMKECMFLHGVEISYKEYGLFLKSFHIEVTSPNIEAISASIGMLKLHDMDNEVPI